MNNCIHTVGLIGAGAVGAYIIWCFQDIPDIDFCLVAEGERAARLQKEGLIINNKVFRPAVRSAEEFRRVCGDREDGEACPDLLFVAVKGSSLSGTLDLIRRSTGEKTIIMSLMNGIDSEEIIGDVTGRSHLLYSLIRIASHRTGSSVSFDPENTLGVYYGEPGKTGKTSRVLRVEDLFARTGLHYHFKEDIITDMWIKYCSNITNNLPQAILGVGSGAFQDSRHADWIRLSLEDEVIRVAAADGVSLKPLGHLQGYKKSARYSTLQDLDDGRHTEVDMFLGVLMRKAKAAGIQVPAAEYTWHLIKALEEKNDGLFDYSPSE